jgi:hypothetical protein
MNLSLQSTRLIAAALLLLPAAAMAQQKVQLPAADKLLRERPAMIYSLGVEEGEDHELFSGIRSVAFDDKDNVYLLDGNNYRILVFDANGKFVRKISKQGGGPGELMGPASMTVTSDGSIVVNDIGRRAFSIFKFDGTFVKNVPFEEGEMPMMGTNALQAHPRGGVVGRVNAMFNFGGAARIGGRGERGDVNPAQLGGPTGERKSPVKWWDLGTGKATQVHEFVLPSITPKVQESGGGRGERRLAVMISQPMWGAPTAFGVLPNGAVAIVSEKDYRIKIANGGKVERIIERPIAARKGTEKDKKAQMEAQRENLKSGRTGGISMTVNNGATRIAPATGGGRNGELPSLEQMLANATFEEFIPVLRRVDTDPQGRIWVTRTPADFGVKASVDLLRADGTYIGTVPSFIAPDAVSKSGRAAFIERDELGVEHVVVRKLPASWQFGSPIS